VPTCGGVQELPWSYGNRYKPTCGAFQDLTGKKNSTSKSDKYKQARFLQQTDMGRERRHCSTSIQILPELPFLPPCGSKLHSVPTQLPCQPNLHSNNPLSSECKH